MSLYFFKTPVIIQRMFKDYNWSFSNSNQKTIYLTFDDGPTPEVTEWTLDILKEYNAKATFFCIGKNVSNHPTIFKRIMTDGHSIGNHTQNHLNGWRTNIKDYIQNVLMAEKVISTTLLNNENRNATNNHQLVTNLFRPPYGKIKRKQGIQLIEKGYNIIMWDVLSGDFDMNLNQEKCLQNVLKNTKKGSIVILHDSLKAEKKLKYVLPKVLKHFGNKGYKFSNIVLPN